MPLIAKDKSSQSSFTPVPPGMHLARCFRVIDLGTQTTVWMGKEKHLEKVLIQFEIHSEDNEGRPLLTAAGEPLSISKRYTNVLSDNSTLTEDLGSWRGGPLTKPERKNFDLERLLGVWAMLNVIESQGQDGNTYTNIETINPVPAQVKKAGLPEAHNETLLYSIQDSTPADFAKLSENLQKTIQKSPEWQAKYGGKSHGGFTDDSLDDVF